MEESVNEGQARIDMMGMLLAQRNIVCSQAGTDSIYSIIPALPSDGAGMVPKIDDIEGQITHTRHALRPRREGWAP